MIPSSPAQSVAEIRTDIGLSDGQAARKSVTYAILILWAFICLFPIYWTVTTAFKEAKDKEVAALVKLGITSVQDLLQHYPRYHVDRTNLRTIRELKQLATEQDLGEVQVHGVVKKLNRPFKTRSGKLMITGTIGDETGSISVTWFNQQWVMRALSPGTEAVGVPGCHFGEKIDGTTADDAAKFAQAAGYIFGYTIQNDVSDRGGRGDGRHGSDWLSGKSHDTIAPLGPFVVGLAIVSR